MPDLCKAAFPVYDPPSITTTGGNAVKLHKVMQLIAKVSRFLAELFRKQPPANKRMP